MVVQHNLTAMNANRYLGINNSKLSKSLEKLSSGYAINRAGDNAAGLAVSEKMRSQIAGMTQGVKNAQDGISMVQTFEGALTETDSILQRMKTLADQSANGTYQDDVDRDAIQLEFDQLNDELNQIADTDFNGVIVLNGGEMADGLKAVNGKFDYSNYVRDPKNLTSGDINRIDAQILDDVQTTNGSTKADTMWNDLNANWKRNDPTKQKGPDSIDFTFEYDESNKTWKCTSASDGADKDKVVIATTAGKTGVTDANHTENGGFAFGTANCGSAVNVVLDGTKLQNGDKITITVNNPYAGKYGPTNAGAEMTDHTGFKEGANTNAIKIGNANLGVAITANSVKDADMNAARESVLSALNGAEFKFTYKAEGQGAAAADHKNVALTLSDGTICTPGAAADDLVKLTLKDGTVCGMKVDENGVTTIGLLDAAGTDIGTTIATLTPTAQTGDMSTNNDGSSGTVTYKIAVDAHAYDNSTSPNAVVKDVNTAVSKSNSFDNAKAPLTYTDHVILQAGARSKDAVDFTFKYTSGGLGKLKANMNCSARADGLNTANLSLRTAEDANAAIDQIDHAINKVSMVRATFGAVQNRLEHKIDNMNVSIENLTSAESGIRDTNMPQEMMNFTKNQILAQASQSMLAQANQLPQSVLSLLQ